MPIVAALRGLLNHHIDIMIVDGDPGRVRVIALPNETATRGTERIVPVVDGNAGLLQALKEIAADLCCN